MDEILCKLVLNVHNIRTRERLQKKKEKENSQGPMVNILNNINALQLKDTFYELATDLIINWGKHLNFRYYKPY